MLNPFWKYGEATTPEIVTGSEDYPTAVANAIAPLDVDGDGDMDLVVSQLGDAVTIGAPTYPVLVFINDGTGKFKDKTSTIFPDTVPHVEDGFGYTVGDFNGDLRPDLFFVAYGPDVAGAGGAPNVLLLSNGAHGFVDRSSTLPTTPNATYGTASGDADGDGDIDLITLGDNSGQHIHLLINDGTGHYGIEDDRLDIIFDTGTPADGLYNGPGSGAFCDFDRDGDQDMLLGTAGYGRHSIIMFNDGTGHFATNENSIVPYVFEGVDAIEFIAIADFNLDGKMDAAFAAANNVTAAGKVAVMLGNDIGGLEQPPDNLFPDGPSSTHIMRTMMAVDFNSDGYTDIVIGDGKEEIFLNDGTGHFKTLPSNALIDDDEFVFSMTTGDFNGDGRTDFAGYWPDRTDALAHYRVYLSHDLPKTQTGDGAANTILGDDDGETLSGLGGKDIVFSGRGKDRLFGGAGNDYLNGGMGSDQLHGGAGKDTMFGGTGADKFFFDTSLAKAGVDRIQDFAHGQDHIVLDDAFFAVAHTSSALKAAAFHVLPSGHEAQGHAAQILYDEMTGGLWYDKDGDGAAAAVQLAFLTSKPHDLDRHDFLVV